MSNLSTYNTIIMGPTFLDSTRVIAKTGIVKINPNFISSILELSQEEFYIYNELIEELISLKRRFVMIEKLLLSRKSPYGTLPTKLHNGLWSVRLDIKEVSMSNGTSYFIPVF